VTVRLVVREDEDGEAEEDEDRDDFDRDRDVAAAFIGKGDGVICRRDKVSDSYVPSFTRGRIR
jgi:hypothetical protein